MATPEKIDRKYRIEDAVMLEASKTMRSFFIIDKAAFIAFDALYNDPFMTTWLTKITAAETFIGDDAVIDQMVQETNTVEAKMKLCREHWGDSKYFIEKAFPNNEAVWNEFGYNDFRKARDNQPLMVQFMQIFFKVATKYTAQLTAPAVGYTAAKIALINTLKNDLNTADISQETFKGSRTLMGQDRVILHNIVWDVMADQVSKAGKIIFKNNFAKYLNYLLPPSEQLGFPKEGANDAGETDNIYHPQNPLAAGKLFKFKNTGTTIQVFCLAATATDACVNGVIIQPGTEEIHPASDLGNIANTYLNVTNLGAVQGSWEVDEV